MDCKEYITKRGFPLSLEVMGKIVGYSASHLRKLYKDDQPYFDELTEHAINKWLSIVDIKFRYEYPLSNYFEKNHTPKK